MNNLQFLAIVQFIAVPVLLVIALAVRFAGSAKPLNIVDYSRVRDPAALHRWAGNRLLLLPLGFAIAGVVSFRHPEMALLILAATTLFAIGLAVWLAIGARRFQHAP
ncbi:MAG: hypothetical protein LC130_04815 [Bryobacterales bacterium]|nr:hypothetical protein [Rhodocyclaceae bacterium]MCZ2074306.1 hypothetical protein [Bryobacterales bacterium]